MAPKRDCRFVEIRDAAKGVRDIDRGWQLVENFAEMVFTRVRLHGRGKGYLGTHLGKLVTENVTHGRLPIIRPDTPITVTGDKVLLAKEAHPPIRQKLSSGRMSKCGYSRILR